VADLNGLVWEISPIGLTSNGSNYFLLNTSVDVATITSGVSLATDAWGSTGLAAMYTDIGTTYGPLTASSTNKVFGNAAQVLSEATSGTAWAMAGAGVPLVGGVGGSNQFGSDYMYDARPNEMCPFVGGLWGTTPRCGGLGPALRHFARQLGRWLTAFARPCIFEHLSDSDGCT
jgi:hypothetical protein